MNYETIILGSGPAGLTCGIYTSRAKLKTLIIDFPLIPTQIVLTDIIENYPGFPEGISGFDLYSKLKAQSEKFGCEHISAQAEPSFKVKDNKIILEVDNKLYKTETLVLATGRRWKSLGLENETKFVGNGISYCGTCDAAFFKEKIVCVIGGGDTALQETLFISKFVKKIYLIHRRKEFRGTKILQEKVFAKDNVEVITPAIVEKFLGDKKIQAVEIKFVDSEKKQIIKCDGIFIFVGARPNTDFVKKNLTETKIDLDDEGYVITNNKMETNIEGIYACGDCRKNLVKQVVSACGEAAIAAISITNYLEHRKI